MEKNFTRAMVCQEFKPTNKCRECPLHSEKNFKSIPCWLLTDDEINTIMKDYPYADVKIRMIFNDIGRRLAVVEEKVEKKDEPKFTMFEVIDKKLYDKLFIAYHKLEDKHESDCRLISEYDLEIKKLKKQNEEQNETVNYVYSNLCTEQKERIRCEAVIEDWKKRYNELEYMYEKKDAENNRLEDEISTLNKQIDSFGLTCRLYEKETKDLKSDVERWVERYERLRDMDKKRLFDFKNAENERDHYKGLYSSKCDDYDALLEKKIENEKTAMEEVAKYKNLFHSLNHKHQKVVGEMKAWKDKYKCINDDYIGLEKEYNTVLSTKNSLEFKCTDLEQKLKEAEKPDKLRPVLEKENNALRAALKTVTEDRDILKSDYYLVQKTLETTKEKYNDACKMNKMREDVFNSNLKLQKTIEAKDREIDLLRAELDKYKTDDECDDRWID